MKKTLAVALFSIFLFSTLFSTSVYADLPTNWQSPAELVGGSMDEALKQITTTLERSVISVIFALALLQMTISGIKQLISGEMDKTIMNLAMNITWAGLALWLLAGAANPVEPGVSNLGDLLWRIQHFAMSIVSSMTGDVEFSAGAIFAIGLQSYGFITLAVTKAMSTNVVNVAAMLFVPGISLMTAFMTFFISVVIMLACAYLALKVFITKIEFAILIAVAPLNAALLVFAPTREQGWAPFRGALALVYRVLILGGTVAAIGIVAKTLANYVNAQAWGVVADVWTPLLSASFAFCLLAFVAHKSDAIASSMASGTSNLSSGDLTGSIAAGVAAGMTGGAALAATGAAASGGTGVKAMGDFMKGLTDASPVARGAQAMRQSVGIGGGELTKPAASPAAASLLQQRGNAAAGVMSAGGGKEVAKAASEAIQKGGGSREIASAVMSVGGNQEQATAGAVAASMGDATKEFPKAFNAGIDAAATGKSPEQIGQAIQEAGGSSKLASTASTAAKEAQQGGQGDASSAGIGGKATTPEQERQAKMIEAMQMVSKHAGNLSQHIQRDSTPTSVHINTNQTD